MRHLLYAQPVVWEKVDDLQGVHPLRIVHGRTRDNATRVRVAVLDLISARVDRPAALL